MSNELTGKDAVEALVRVLSRYTDRHSDDEARDIVDAACAPLHLIPPPQFRIAPCPFCNSAETVRVIANGEHGGKCRVCDRQWDEDTNATINDHRDNGSPVNLEKDCPCPVCGSKNSSAVCSDIDQLQRRCRDCRQEWTVVLNTYVAYTTFVRKNPEEE